MTFIICIFVIISLLWLFLNFLLFVVKALYYFYWKVLKQIKLLLLLLFCVEKWAEIHRWSWRRPWLVALLSQAHILEYGLAVHEKVVPQDMRPLHKKLVDQFHLMKSSLGIQVGQYMGTLRVLKGCEAFLVRLWFSLKCTICLKALTLKTLFAPEASVVRPVLPHHEANICIMHP